MTDDEIKQLARTTIFSYDEVWSVAWNLSKPKGDTGAADSRVVEKTLELAAAIGGRLYGPYIWRGGAEHDMGPVASVMTMLAGQRPEPIRATILHPYKYTLRNGELVRKER